MTVLVLLASCIAISHAIETQRRVEAELELARVRASVDNYLGRVNEQGWNGITIDH